jgi:hypothetical protein
MSKTYPAFIIYIEMRINIYVFTLGHQRAANITSNYLAIIRRMEQPIQGPSANFKTCLNDKSRPQDDNM